MVSGRFHRDTMGNHAECVGLAARRCVANMMHAHALGGVVQLVNGLSKRSRSDTRKTKQHERTIHLNLREFPEDFGD